MLTDKITIGGNTYGVAYCYGTEVAFSAIANKEISEIDWTKAGTSARIIDLIIAAVYAYYDKDHKESPITDRDILYTASKAELVKAFEIIWKMAVAWNTLPKAEEEAAKAEQAAEAAQEGDEIPKN